MRHSSSPIAIYVVGYDGGFAHVGVSVVRLAANPAFDELIELHHWTTKKSDKKRDVLAANDDFRRARELSARVLELHRRLDGVSGHGIRAIAVEAKSPPRNARTSAQISMFLGVLACATEIGSYSVVQAGPQEIRRRFDLPTKAKKPEVHERLFRRFTNLKEKLDDMRGRGPLLTDSQWEAARLHPLDSLAAIVAADGSEVIRMLRSLV